MVSTANGGERKFVNMTMQSGSGAIKGIEEGGLSDYLMNSDVAETTNDKRNFRNIFTRRRLSHQKS